MTVYQIGLLKALIIMAVLLCLVIGIIIGNTISKMIFDAEKKRKIFWK